MLLLFADLGTPTQTITILFCFVNTLPSSLNRPAFVSSSRWRYSKYDADSDRRWSERKLEDHMKDYGDIICVYDSNVDGYISKDEFNQAINSSTIFDKYDADGDASFALSEWNVCETSPLLVAILSRVWLILFSLFSEFVQVC